MTNEEYEDMMRKRKESGWLLPAVPKQDLTNELPAININMNRGRIIIPATLSQQFGYPAYVHIWLAKPYNQRPSGKLAQAGFISMQQIIGIAPVPSVSLRDRFFPSLRGKRSYRSGVNKTFTRYKNGPILIDAKRALESLLVETGYHSTVVIADAITLSNGVSMDCNYLFFSARADRGDHFS
jgi:hypothetical protein